MKKIKLTITLIIALMCVSEESKALFGIGDVSTDPVLAALIERLNSTMEVNNQIQQLILQKITVIEKKAVDMKHGNFMQIAQSLQRIYKLLEAITCQYERTNLIINAFGGLNNCKINLQYNLALFNQEYSNDLVKIGIVAVDLFLFTDFERGKILKNIEESLEKSVSLLRLVSGTIMIHVEGVIMNAYNAIDVEKEAKVMMMGRSYSGEGEIVRWQGAELVGIGIVFDNKTKVIALLLIIPFLCIGIIIKKIKDYGHWNNFKCNCC